MRPHRFPPLSQLGIGAALPAGATNQQVQARLAEGFEEGLRDGYRDGHLSGLDAGQAEGLALGREEGLKAAALEARAEAQARFEGLAAPVDAVLAELLHTQEDYRSALRKEVVDLVGRVARQVIRCELALQPIQLLALVDETLATMPPPHKGVEVFLNSEDLRRIQEIDSERGARWTLVADPALEPGECRVKAGRREADAGCRQRLAAVMDQVSEQLLGPGAMADMGDAIGVAESVQAMAADVVEPVEVEVAAVVEAVAEETVADVVEAELPVAEVAAQPAPRKVAAKTAEPVKSVAKPAAKSAAKAPAAQEAKAPAAEKVAERVTEKAAAKPAAKAASSAVAKPADKPAKPAARPASKQAAPSMDIPASPPVAKRSRKAAEAAQVAA
ncbi:MAG: fliH [Rhizobacter sp.]|nr:fliH [Rhizobacter sp.]